MSRVVYFEMPADDPKQLTEFYARVFGWQTRTLPDVEGYYMMLTGTPEHTGINGGIMLTGTPEHTGINGGIMGRHMDFIANHIAVDSVDKYLKLAVSKGAEIITPKMHVDKLGDFAWCEDPQGNEFVLAQLDPHYYEFIAKLLAQGTPLGEVKGRMVHFEIPADDPDKLAKFYIDVFGWKIEKWEGPIEYYMISTGPETEPGIDGAIMRRDNVQGTVNTIGIGDLDKIIEDVLANGGEQFTSKEEIPGVGWFAYCADPQGNLFGLMQPTGMM